MYSTHTHISTLQGIVFCFIPVDVDIYLIKICEIEWCTDKIVWKVLTIIDTFMGLWDSDGDSQMIMWIFSHLMCSCLMELWGLGCVDTVVRLLVWRHECVISQYFMRVYPHLTYSRLSRGTRVWMCVTSLPAGVMVWPSMPFSTPTVLPSLTGGCWPDDCHTPASTTPSDWHNSTLVSNAFLILKVGTVQYMIILFVLHP